MTKPVGNNETNYSLPRTTSRQPGPPPSPAVLSRCAAAAAAAVTARCVRGRGEPADEGAPAPGACSQHRAVKRRALWGGGCPGPGTPEPPAPVSVLGVSGRGLGGRVARNEVPEAGGGGSFRAAGTAAAAQSAAHAEKLRPRPNNGLVRIVLPPLRGALGLIKGPRNPTPRPPRRTKAGRGGPGGFASTGRRLSGSAAHCAVFPEGCGTHAGSLPGSRGATPRRPLRSWDEANDGDTGRARGRRVRGRLRSHRS